MQNQNAHTDHEALIVKYLAGEANPAEKAELEKWLAADSANRVTFQSFQNAWDSVEPAKARQKLDMDAEWARLDQAISGAEQSGKVVEMQSQAKGSGLSGYLRIAAILLLLCLSGAAIYFYTQYQWQSIVAGNEITEEVLPDGSKVALNRNSELRYSRHFGKDERAVALSGEAFFEVTRDEAKPFVVDAGEIAVKVLGTSFYVNNRAGGQNIEVIVRSGKVQVAQQGPEAAAVMLEAGDKALFSKATGRLQKSLNEDANYLAWKTRRLIFKGVPLEVIAKEVGHVYGREIQVKSEAIRHCPVTVTFEGQTLPEVLNVLEATLDVKIEESGTQISITGKGC